MSEPYLGQIQTFSFPFAPRGWAPCNGQLLPINRNQALFSLLGTQFGGDGISTFALPNLQGNFSLGQGSGFVVGQTGGEPNHTLVAGEMAPHLHPMVGTQSAPNSSNPANNFPTQSSAYQLFDTTTGPMLGPGSTSSGQNAGHLNMPPFLAMNVCICIAGIFPART